VGKSIGGTVKIVIVTLVIVVVLAVVGDVYFGLQTKNLNTDNAVLSANVTLANIEIVYWQDQFDTANKTAEIYKGMYNTANKTAEMYKGMYNKEKANSESLINQLTAEKANSENLTNQLAAANKTIADLRLQILLGKDRTYEQILAFLRDDKTDEIFNVNYMVAAQQVVRHAQQQGLKACWVVVCLAGYEHAYNFVGFYAKDLGKMVYFTACEDWEAKLIVGENYYTINGDVAPNFDATIIDIEYYYLVGSEWVDMD
jgi:hypothetical protein